MASLGSKVFMSLGRTNISVLALNKATNRATYATVLSVNSPSGNKGEFVADHVVLVK